jgi:hypothetical protein
MKKINKKSCKNIKNKKSIGSSIFNKKIKKFKFISNKYNNSKPNCIILHNNYLSNQKKLNLMEIKLIKFKINIEFKKQHYKLKLGILDKNPILSLTKIVIKIYIPVYLKVIINFRSYKVFIHNYNLKRHLLKNIKIILMLNPQKNL